MKILRVDESRTIRNIQKNTLSGLGYDDIAEAADGLEALSAVATAPPDLIILDIGLPDSPGLDVLRALRQISDVPIAMLTAQSEEAAIARYLEEGADEYVVKPFSHIEFIGRMQALIRRSGKRQKPRPRTLHAIDLTMDFEAAEVYRAGQPISLTRTGLALLEQLVRTATRVVTYEALASSIELEGHPVDQEGRLLRLHVRQLQSKLGDDEVEPKYIANVIGLGYKFLPKITSSILQAPLSEASPAAEPQQTAEPVGVPVIPRTAANGGPVGA